MYGGGKTEDARKAAQTQKGILQTAGHDRSRARRPPNVEAVVIYAMSRHRVSAFKHKTEDKQLRATATAQRLILQYHLMLAKILIYPNLKTRLSYFNRKNIHTVLQ